MEGRARWADPIEAWVNGDADSSDILDIFESDDDLR